MSAETRNQLAVALHYDKTGAPPQPAPARAGHFLDRAL